MQWFHFGRHAAWLPCVVEVELGLDDHDTGLLTVHYTHSGKQMVNDWAFRFCLVSWSDRNIFVHKAKIVIYFNP